jgi:hypothetical protein
MTYEDIFMEGYYDALNEAKKEEDDDKKSFWKKHKKKIIAGALAGAAVAGTAAAVHHDNKKSIKYVDKQIADSKKSGGSGRAGYIAPDNNGTITSHIVGENSSKKDKIKVGRVLRAKDFAERLKYKYTPKDQFRQEYIDRMEKERRERAMKHYHKLGLGVKQEEYDELDEIFMEGYYDALNEMTEIDNYGDEYDYDEYNEYDELSDIDEDDIKHSYSEGYYDALRDMGVSC